MTSSNTTLSYPISYALVLLLQLLFCSNSFATDITQTQLLDRLNTNSATLVLDVRKPDEFAAGHVPGAINIPHTEIEKYLDKLRADINNEIVVYCESGRRAAIAIDILKQDGFSKVLHLQGDMKAWRMEGLPTASNNSGSGP